jgi:hypothetical protein
MDFIRFIAFCAIIFGYLLDWSIIPHAGTARPALTLAGFSLVIGSPLFVIPRRYWRHIGVAWSAFVLIALGVLIGNGVANCDPNVSGLLMVEMMLIFGAFYLLTIYGLSAIVLVTSITALLGMNTELRKPMSPGLLTIIIASASILSCGLTYWISVAYGSHPTPGNCVI